MGSVSHSPERWGALVYVAVSSELDFYFALIARRLSLPGELDCQAARRPCLMPAQSPAGMGSVLFLCRECHVDGNPVQLGPGPPPRQKESSLLGKRVLLLGKGGEAPSHAAAGLETGTARPLSSSPPP